MHKECIIQPQRLLRLALLYQAALQETRTFPQLSLIQLANLGTWHFSHTVLASLAARMSHTTARKKNVRKGNTEDLGHGAGCQGSAPLQSIAGKVSVPCASPASPLRFQAGFLQAGTTHSTNSCPVRKPDVLCEAQLTQSIAGVKLGASKRFMLHPCKHSYVTSSSHANCTHAHRKAAFLVVWGFFLMLCELTEHDSSAPL